MARRAVLHAVPRLRWMDNASCHVCISNDAVQQRKESQRKIGSRQVSQAGDAI